MNDEENLLKLEQRLQRLQVVDAELLDSLREKVVYGSVGEGPFTGILNSHGSLFVEFLDVMAYHNTSQTGNASELRELLSRLGPENMEPHILFTSPRQIYAKSRIGELTELNPDE
tara:strand:- start:244 stop:588 length:345 start_codon:yes stop_codon:yes gene_type:complete